MALVITIIIIIILSTVTINMAFGDNGLIKQAQLAKDMTANVIVSENEDTNRVMQEFANVMADNGEGGEPNPVTSVSVNPTSITLTEGETSQLTATILPDNASNKGVTWSSDNPEIASVNSSTGLVTAISEGSATITATATDGSEKKGTCIVTVEEIVGIPEDVSYVGYYADVDENGSVDGIIYADQAIGGSGQWYDSSGTYSIPKKSNLKKYKEEGTYETSGFGTKGVIKLAGGNGEERFYVMALSDIDSSTHYWYYNANGEMDDYASTTSEDFGTGETNTAKMISKWKNEEYGLQNNNDMWGLIQSEVEKGWYVPSRGEWSAFGAAFNITNSNYTNFNLSTTCWSSSQINASGAWRAYLAYGYIRDSYVDSTRYVRLGTTF